jgi:hypothetical protein
MFTKKTSTSGAGVAKTTGSQTSPMVQKGGHAPSNQGGGGGGKLATFKDQSNKAKTAHQGGMNC